MQNYIHAAPETGENRNMFTTWLLKFVFLAAGNQIIHGREIKIWENVCYGSWNLI